MYCSNCGEKIESYERFCPMCGEAVVGDEQMASDGVVENEWNGEGYFCPHCGTEIDENTEKCEWCDNYVNAPENLQQNAVAETGDTFTKEETDVEKTKGIPWMRLIRLGAVLALICFLFPFTMVSCSGDEISFTGTEMMTAIPMQEDVDLEEEYPPNLHLIIAFGAGVATLVVSLATKEGEKMLVGASVCSATAALFLFLFRSTFMRYYELEEYSGYVHVEFLWGWHLCLIAYLILAIAMYCVHLRDGQE